MGWSQKPNDALLWSVRRLLGFVNRVAQKRNAPCGASGQRCYRWRGSGMIARGAIGVKLSLTAVEGFLGVAKVSDRLRRVSSASFTVGRKVLKDSQLPDDMVKRDGFVLRRPDQWC